MASQEKYVLEWVLVRERGSKEFITVPVKKTKRTRKWYNEQSQVKENNGNKCSSK